MTLTPAQAEFISPNGFVLYQRPAGGNVAKSPAVTVNRNTSGLRLSLNTKARELLGNPSRALLYVDREGRRVGIQPCSEGEGAKLSKAGGISATALIKAFDLKYGSRPVQLIDGMLIFGMDVDE